MKKVLFVFALGAILSSCGSKSKSACECFTVTKEIMKEVKDAMGDLDKSMELAKKAEANRKACANYTIEDYKDCN